MKEEMCIDMVGKERWLVTVEENEVDTVKKDTQ